MPNRFGMGWNVSDILGGLGDAISVGAGGNANYLNQVRQDNYGLGMEDLLAGNTAKGLKTMSSAVGPEETNKAYYNLRRSDAEDAQNDNTAARNAVLNQGTQSEIDKRNREQQDLNRYRYLGLLRTATPENYAQVKALADRVAAKNGYTPDFDVPQVFTTGWADNMSRSELTPKEWASDAESRRYHDTTTDRQERDFQTDVIFKGADLKLKGAKLRQDAILGGGRLVTGAQNADSNAVRAGATQQNANTSLNRATAAVIQSVRKSAPDAKFQTNPSNGKVRFSTDGGKTWRPAN